MRLPDHLQVLLVPVLCLGLLGFAWWLLRDFSEPEPDAPPVLRVLCDDAFRHAAAEVAEAFERRGQGAVEARYLPAGELPAALAPGGWDLVVTGPGPPGAGIAAHAAPDEGQDAGAEGAPGDPAPPRARVLQEAADPDLADAFARFFNGPVGREAFAKHRPAPAP